MLPPPADIAARCVATMIQKLLFLATVIYCLLAKNTGDRLYFFLAIYLSVLTPAVWCYKRGCRKTSKKDEKPAP